MAENEKIIVGEGDNVFTTQENLTGIIRRIYSTGQVGEYLESGVPPETIAVIDDCGATLTAPIMDQFKGIVCLAGTVRSHLGILAREFEVPCLMNAQLEEAVAEGDLVEVEYTAPSPTASSSVRARVWKVGGGNI